MFHTKLFTRRVGVPLLAGLLALLTACGGGSDVTVSNTNTAAMLSGTAATGAAIVGGVVTLKCASGTTASPITGADGAFSVDISGATLPCLVKVSYKDASGAA